MNLAFALSNLAAIAYQQGAYREARASYKQALSKAQEFGSIKGDDLLPERVCRPGCRQRQLLMSPRNYVGPQMRFVPPRLASSKSHTSGGGETTCSMN